MHQDGALRAGTIAAMHVFTWIFLAALFSGTLLQLWLTARQARHVAAHRDQVPEPFREAIPLEDHRRAAAYTLARLALERWQLLWDGLILLGWTLGGGLEALARLWDRVALPEPWHGAALVLLVVILSDLLELPLQLRRIFGIEQRFGFNRLTPLGFLRDKLLGGLLLLAIGLPLAAAMLWLMREAGDRWWLWAWLLWVAFSLFVSWAWPVLIAPLFNRFEPLPDGPLKQRLEALLRRTGFTSKGLYVMDGSRRSAHGNAYFTGLGRAKRIVFFDTLLEQLDDEQLEAVLAHELGHFRLHHIRRMLWLQAALSLGALALLGWLSAQPWFYQALGVSRPSPAMALILFLLVSPVFGVFFSPLLAQLSRRHEFEADAFAARHSSARALIAGLLRLYRDNASTLTPDPLYSAFHYSHPPASERIAHLQALEADTETPPAAAPVT